PADLMASASGCQPQLVSAVDLAVRHPQHHQHLHHHRVTHRSRRGGELALLGGVVAARSHLQGLADGLDSELVTVLVDEPDKHVHGRSSSAWAKYADAFRKISFARFSSLT